MRTLLYIVIAMIITGCRYSSPQSGTLDEATRLLHEDPATALSKLNGLDVSEFRDSATMARWALLYSEALVANHLSAPTDTIVNIAVDYYGSHNQRDKYLKASRLKALIMAAESTDTLATALYLQKEKEFMLYKERAKSQLYIFATITILLIAAGIILWMRQRIRLQTARNNALMAEASGLRCIMDARADEVDRLESTLRGLLDNRFSLIDSLCQTYYETQGTKAERNAIVDKVKNEIKAVSTDSFPEMEKAVNDCRDNLLDKVRTLYPAIKPEEYQLLVYLACSLSSRTVSLLLGQSVETVYKRKSRLKSRLGELVAPSCPGIMTIF